MPTPSEYLASAESALAEAISTPLHSPVRATRFAEATAYATLAFATGFGAPVRLVVPEEAPGAPDDALLCLTHPPEAKPKRSRARKPVEPSPEP